MWGTDGGMSAFVIVGCRKVLGLFGVMCVENGGGWCYLLSRVGLV